MKYEEIVERYNSFKQSAFENATGLLNKKIRKNSELLQQIFLDSFQELCSDILIIQGADPNKQLFTMEYSILLSSLLEAKPCFALEAYGVDWYYDTLATYEFEIELFESIWKDLKIELHREAHRYWGQIYAESTVRDSLAWALMNASKLIPHCKSAVTSAMKTDYFLKLNKNESFKIYFGTYKGMNEILIQTEGV